MYAYRPHGQLEPVSMNVFSFIATGPVVMPGTDIGRSGIVGGCTVVRVTIPDYRIVIRSSGQIVGDTQDCLRKPAVRYRWGREVPQASQCV